MTDLVIHSDQSPPTPQALAPILGGQLPETLQLCNAIAAAGELIPPFYRGKPGAVLLAKLWADKHAVDLFTAIQNIDIIDGKPWVKIALRIELAIGRGFEFKVTTTNDEQCTVEVWNTTGGIPKQIGDPITARFDDRTRRLKYNSGKATPWALHPADLLFAEACRIADRRYVRTAAGMIDNADNPDPDDHDPVATISATTTPPPDLIDTITLAPPDTHTAPPLPAQEPPATFTPDIPDRAPEPQPEATEGRKTGDELRALITGHPSRLVSAPKGIRATHEAFPDADLADYDKIAAHDGAHDFTLDWIARGGKDQ